MLSQWFLANHWFARVEILHVVFRCVVVLLLSFVVVMLWQMNFSVSIQISIYPLKEKRKVRKVFTTTHEHGGVQY